MIVSHNRVKIAFRLTRDSDDYPPADWEHLWAIPRGGNIYEMDNIPFFVRNISLGDFVSAHRDSDAELIFDAVVQRGGHSTVRVVMFAAEQREEVRRDLAKLGCESEGSHIPKLLSVDIPAAVPYEKVRTFLSQKAAEGLFDYEEAAIQHRTD